MEGTNPNSPTPPQRPAAIDGEKEKQHFDHIGSVATPRMPVMPKGPAAEHTFDLSPRQEKALHALMPWMKVDATERPLGNRTINHIRRTD